MSSSAAPESTGIVPASVPSLRHRTGPLTLFGVRIQSHSDTPPSVETGSGREPAGTAVRTVAYRVSTSSTRSSCSGDCWSRNASELPKRRS